MLNEINVDHDGAMSFQEFIPLMERKMKDTDGEEDIIEAFKVFDRDGSGKINLDEIKHIMANLGEKLSDVEMDEMLSTAQVDNNG